MNRRALFLSVINCAALACCTTASDLRAHPPFIETTSTRSVAEISQCLAGEWEKRSGSVTQNIIDRGVAMRLTYMALSRQIVAAMVDITDSVSARNVVVRASKGDAGAKLRGEVLSCV